MNAICKVSLCNRRTNSRYKNQEKPWAWLKERNRIPVRTTETVAEYPKLPKEERDALKDQGGFVGGWLREGIRKNGNVICRTIGALDADDIPDYVDFPAVVRASLPGIEWFVYSTHKHTPEAPRFRLVVLFDREVSEEEYPAVMRQVAADIGMDYFDDSTYQANRMMYWASCPSDGEFIFDESSGSPLPVDKYLARYEKWQDTTQWPTSSRQSQVEKQAASAQQDPLNKEGLVGVFCRTYFPVQSALEKFLPDKYAPTGADGRWDYIPADSTAGVVIYDDRFVYSHHTTDPACGKLLNAFDIVRIHKFGDDDSKKTFQQMCAFALEQDEVKLRLDRERQESISADFAGYCAGDGKAEAGSADAASGAAGAASGAAGAGRDWTKLLRYKPKSSVLEPSVDNLMLIFTHDPELRGFALNEMAHRVEVTGEMPWPRTEGERFWSNMDDSCLRVYLFSHYAEFPERLFQSCLDKTARLRKFHPVRDYLESLPEWDGEERIENLFQRCLHADDTPYIRAVARKVFAAAVARVMQPGVKFDSIPVLDGEQGIGKSSLFRDLVGPAFYSETLSLTDMSDKSGAEKLQGFWVVEIGELAGMRKADIEKVKAFLSTTDDTYRPSYGRVVENHPRQCIIVATVNGDRGYLRDTTGNRRFWIVKCRQSEQMKRYSFSEEEKDQIWAEALQLFRSGEKLYLEDELLKEAEVIQRGAMEEDDRQGIVEAYLDTLLPLNWPDMDLFERRAYFSGLNDPTRAQGIVRRETVSNVEIWSECFGYDPMNMKKQDSYEISAIMMRIGGWDRSGKREYLPVYGRQRLYIRCPDAPRTGDNGTAIPGNSESCDEPLPDNGTGGTASQESLYDFLL